MRVHFDTFTREWVNCLATILTSVQENAIISMENAFISHKELAPSDDEDNNNNKSYHYRL